MGDSMKVDSVTQLIELEEKDFLWVRESIGMAILSTINLNGQTNHFIKELETRINDVSQRAFELGQNDIIKKLVERSYR